MPQGRARRVRASAMTAVAAAALVAPPSHSAEPRVVEAPYSNARMPGPSPKLEARVLRGETTVVVEVRDETGLAVIGQVDGKPFCGTTRVVVRPGQRLVVTTAYGYYNLPPNGCPQGVEGVFRATFS